MKIRGNTVGTTMSPDRIADRIGGSGVTEDDVKNIIDEQMEHITESVINALPVYNGEVVE